MAANPLDEFRKLARVEHELESRRTSIAAANTILSEFVMAGSMGSSRYHVTMAGHYADGLGRFKDFLFQKWTSYFKPYTPDATIEQQAAIKAAVVAAFSESYEEFNRALLEHSPYGVVNPNGECHRDFHTMAARLLAALEAEIGIDMTSPPPKPTIRVTTLGDNSPVNVGPGSLTQSIQMNTSAADLASALEALLAQIDAQRQAGANGLDDARDLVEQAKQEAEKPEPRFGKVALFLQGVKTTLETVAAISPAWKAVVTVAAAIGFTV